MKTLRLLPALLLSLTLGCATNKQLAQPQAQQAPIRGLDAPVQVFSDSVICSLQIQKSTDSTIIPGWWKDGPVNWTVSSPDAVLERYGQFEARVKVPPHETPVSVTVNAQAQIGWPAHPELMNFSSEIPLTFMLLTPPAKMVITVKPE